MFLVVLWVYMIEVYSFIIPLAVVGTFASRPCVITQSGNTQCSLHERQSMAFENQSTKNELLGSDRCPQTGSSTSQFLEKLNACNKAKLSRVTLHNLLSSNHGQPSRSGITAVLERNVKRRIYKYHE